jgi:hypothetical protein
MYFVLKGNIIGSVSLFYQKDTTLVITVDSLGNPTDTTVNISNQRQYIANPYIKYRYTFEIDYIDNNGITHTPYDEPDRNNVRYRFKFGHSGSAFAAKCRFAELIQQLQCHFKRIRLAKYHM